VIFNATSPWDDAFPSSRRDLLNCSPWNQEFPSFASSRSKGSHHSKSKKTNRVKKSRSLQWKKKSNGAQERRDANKRKRAAFVPKRFGDHTCVNQKAILPLIEDRTRVYSPFDADFPTRQKEWVWGKTRRHHSKNHKHSKTVRSTRLAKRMDAYFRESFRSGFPECRGIVAGLFIPVKNRTVFESVSPFDRKFPSGDIYDMDSRGGQRTRRSRGIRRARRMDTFSTYSPFNDKFPKSIIKPINTAQPVKQQVPVGVFGYISPMAARPLAAFPAMTPVAKANIVPISFNLPRTQPPTVVRPTVQQKAPHNRSQAI